MKSLGCHFPINSFVAFRKAIRFISTHTHTLGHGPNIPIKASFQSVISMPSGGVGSSPGLWLGDSGVVRIIDKSYWGCRAPLLSLLVMFAIMHTVDLSRAPG